MTTIFILFLAELMSGVVEPSVLLASRILSPPLDSPMVSLTHYFIWSIATVLLAGGLIAALTLKEKGMEGLNTVTIIGDIIILLSLVLFSVYTVCMCVWLTRQHMSFYPGMAPFN
jgi:hypothetical protein